MQTWELIVLLPVPFLSWKCLLNPRFAWMNSLCGCGWPWICDPLSLVPERWNSWKEATALVYAVVESKPGALCAIGEHTTVHLCPGYRPRLGLAFLSSGACGAWLLLLLCIMGCVQLTLNHSVPWLWFHVVLTWGLSSTVRIVFESEASWIDHCCPMKPSILSWFMGIACWCERLSVILEPEMSGHGCEERLRLFQ